MDDYRLDRAARDWYAAKGKSGRAETGLPGKLKNILTQNVSRDAKAGCVVEAIRDEGSYRGVGIYDVDIERGWVANIAWSGPSAPAHPAFPV
jgi:hypothetical protein